MVSQDANSLCRWLEKYFRFGPNYKGGGYLQVHQMVGSLIDWYNVQFYNRQSPTVPLFWYLTCQAEGPNEYTTCKNLLTTSSNNAPQSALFQIAANGVPLSKLVIGKPAIPSDADSGVMSTSLLADCLRQAKQRGWSECSSLRTTYSSGWPTSSLGSGLMVWQVRMSSTFPSLEAWHSIYS